MPDTAPVAAGDPELPDPLSAQRAYVEAVAGLVCTQVMPEGEASEGAQVHAGLLNRRRCTAAFADRPAVVGRRGQVVHFVPGVLPEFGGPDRAPCGSTVMSWTLRCPMENTRPQPLPARPPRSW